MLGNLADYWRSAYRHMVPVVLAFVVAMFLPQHLLELELTESILFQNAAIVQAIIQMARSLRLRTIAEGVETADALDQLRALGCDEAQGYYFARPLSPEAALHFFEERVRPGGARADA